jgi:ABC-2 type transport system ATP-binding protein
MLHFGLESPTYETVGNPLREAIIRASEDSARMLLHTEKLSKAYGSFLALDALELDVAPGEIVGLLGPNGSGKSTALRLMLGFLRPSAGRASIAGHDCWHDGAAARRHVAYLPGELRLYENMTGRQLVRFLGGLRQRDFAATIDTLARRFDIDVSRPIAQLSSGMKRKVALLATLLPETPLIIMDEPTNTLDPNMRDELMQQLREAKGRGQAVLFSSHVLAEVEHVCDRVAILQRGRLVHMQHMQTLRAERRIRVRFDGPAGSLPDLAGLRPRTAGNGTLDLLYAGPIVELLRWLAVQPVSDVRIEPAGLAEVYHRFHPNE